MMATQMLHPSWAAGWERKLFRGDGGIREGILGVIAKLQFVIGTESRIHEVLGNPLACSDIARICERIEQLRVECQSRIRTAAELKTIVAALERFNLAHDPTSAGSVPDLPPLKWSIG